VSNLRAIDVVAQALTGARVEMRQHAILSPGQIRELGRGECGDVEALQIAADLRTIYLACGNGLLAIRMPDALSVAAVRTLMEATIRMDSEQVREMDRTRFKLGPDGRPTKIATEPHH